jgi:hypothetical protein
MCFCLRRASQLWLTAGRAAYQLCRVEGGSKTRLRAQVIIKAGDDVTSRANKRGGDVVANLACDGVQPTTVWNVGRIPRV